MTNFSLTNSDVKHLATLANLPVSEELIIRLTPQLAEILEFVSQLEQVDTSKVDPTAEITGLKNVTRDEIEPECLSQEDALSGAPQTRDGYVVVKGVFENNDQ